ncbi:hypothetical protein HK105_206632 [Polyrhizophydium stewartii]|uniref:Uncharacterized protein n=1 Tax=Polyrhizophydium stewartii TaxID=2732419 RepID=A0ABR4N2X4_9FUNG
MPPSPAGLPFVAAAPIFANTPAAKPPAGDTTTAPHTKRGYTQPRDVALAPLISRRECIRERGIPGDLGPSNPTSDGDPNQQPQQPPPLPHPVSIAKGAQPPPPASLCGNLYDRLCGKGEACMLDADCLSFTCQTPEYMCVDAPKPAALVRNAPKRRDLASPESVPPAAAGAATGGVDPMRQPDTPAAAAPAPAPAAAAAAAAPQPADVPDFLAREAWLIGASYDDQGQPSNLSNDPPPPAPAPSATPAPPIASLDGPFANTTVGVFAPTRPPVCSIIDMDIPPASLNAAQFDTVGQAGACGTCVRLDYAGTSLVARIADRCETCGSAGMDIVRAAFDTLATRTRTGQHQQGSQSDTGSSGSGSGSRGVATGAPALLALAGVAWRAIDCGLAPV